MILTGKLIKLDPSELFLTTDFPTFKFLIFGFLSFDQVYEFSLIIRKRMKCGMAMVGSDNVKYHNNVSLVLGTKGLHWC